ncbi:hypothetical protein UCRPC4_g04690 [Phaeomoniella chlamydospora]|uniref:GH16 domain-containing protein n=1 Tax=Phaeomoniella chlamydospora TaxID=158046 RepID=A0A0G2GQ37_PHACM|nr:hypothetical protein UCRPC4_g04690 [Phaeomoniella chlamydospora]
MSRYISPTGCLLTSLLFSGLVATVQGATTTTSSVYSLQTSYSGSTFFNGFEFWDDADPTHGFVTYVNKTTAQSSGLINAADGSAVYIGTDYTHKYNASAEYYNINGVGRPSVRLQSTQTFTHGLFIADIAHMPGGVCGIWPALWSYGPNWPYGGEIDILEQVNLAIQDQSALHTGYTCNLPGTGISETGSILATNCTYDLNTGANSAGCQVLSADTTSFGSTFNSNGGGVYAMEWTSSAIKVWFFPRGSIPSDISSGAANPAPSGWGTPMANFGSTDSTACNIDKNFAEHQLVIDLTFCGDWAGNVLVVQLDQSLSTKGRGQQYDKQHNFNDKNFDNVEQHYDHYDQKFNNDQHDFYSFDFKNIDFFYFHLLADFYQNVNFVHIDDI